MRAKNGQYLIVSDAGQVLKWLNSDHADALEFLMGYYRDNAYKRPNAFLVQVQAMLDYPEPQIRTLAHERMA
jgi:hypothetical protein